MSNAHNDWLRALDFYKQELGILRGRLTEVAGKNTDAEAMKQVEHFENQFKIQVNSIDTLAHNINKHITAIGTQAQEAKAGYIDGELFTQHNELHNSFSAEEKIIQELRANFNVFAAKWM